MRGEVGLEVVEDVCEGLVLLQVSGSFSTVFLCLSCILSLCAPIRVRNGLGWAISLVGQVVPIVPEQRHQIFLTGHGQVMRGG